MNADPPPVRKPDMHVLETAPSIRPPWIPHPDPAWLTLRTSPEERSTVIAHVSNIEFVRWIDHAAERALARAGWTHEDLMERGVLFFVARHEIDYRLEALPGETLFVATWVRDIRRVKSWRDTVIWRIAGSSPQVVCTASTLWVHVDLQTRRPARITDDMIDALAPVQADAPPWRDRA